MRIAIAGGTGTVGRHVTETARAAGHDVTVLSRSTGTDLTTGDGLAQALDGCDAVIDVSSRQTLSSRGSVEFFQTVTRNLLTAEREAGVPHHVALSIVGAAAIDDGYYAGKAAQERMLAASGTGWSVLRATQFHEFAAQTAARARALGVHVVPHMVSQPVAAAEVAEELVGIAAGVPQERAPDLAGPRVERMPDLVRRWLRATGSRHPVVAVPLPGRMGRGMRDGSVLPGAGARLGSQTFDEWLEHAAG
jgi:uncharacterized protein YbjT (DUF2867 family)